MSHDNSGASRDHSDEKVQSYIMYRLDGELYGTPMLSTREVIKLGEIKEVPYMMSHFRGVINLRGQIVGIVDLRLKFGLEVRKQGQGLILVVETPHGLIGAIVDDLISVEKIHDDAIDRKAQIETKIPLPFFIGVAQVRDRLVNIVDIASCLSAEDMRVSKQQSAG
jgi:purine-binding chemotaxis protein CheW